MDTPLRQGTFILCFAFCSRNTTVGMKTCIKLKSLPNLQTGETTYQVYPFPSAYTKDASVFYTVYD